MSASPAASVEERMTVSDTLREARKLVEREENWGKGLAQRRRGTKCVAEAIEAVVPSPDIRRRALQLFADSVGLVGSAAIPKWNDAPKRKHSDVLRGFDDAIALARKEEDQHA